MNYNNILMIKDSIIYLKHKNTILKLKLNSDILNNSIINSSDKFIKKYNKFLKDNKIRNFIFNKKILIIYDSLISKNDIKKIEDIFIELNYHKIELISDISLININKKDSYLILGNNYKLYYVNDYNEKKLFYINKKCITDSEIKIIIKNRIKNNLFIIGNNINKKIFNDLNYYIYEEIDEFFLNYLFQLNK